MESCQVGFDAFSDDKVMLALPCVPVKTSIRWLFNKLVRMRCPHRAEINHHMITLFDPLDLEFAQGPPPWVAQGGKTHLRQRRTKTQNHVIVVERHDQQWKDSRTQEHSCKKTAGVCLYQNQIKQQQANKRTYSTTMHCGYSDMSDRSEVSDEKQVRSEMPSCSKQTIFWRPLTMTW